MKPSQDLFRSTLYCTQFLRYWSLKLQKNLLLNIIGLSRNKIILSHYKNVDLFCFGFRIISVILTPALSGLCLNILCLSNNHSFILKCSTAMFIINRMTTSIKMKLWNQPVEQTTYSVKMSKILKGITKLLKY